MNMKKIQFYGIWVYSLLSLILILLYRYSTSLFEPKLLGYNLSLWLALIINLFLFVVSVISFRESKFVSSLGIILFLPSTYLFYESWTLANYGYLAWFIIIPIFLLFLKTFWRVKGKEKHEAIPKLRSLETTIESELTRKGSENK